MRAGSTNDIRVIFAIGLTAIGFTTVARSLRQSRAGNGARRRLMVLVVGLSGALIAFIFFWQWLSLSLSDN